LDCFEKAALPTSSDELRTRLLHFAIVGGGPTGIEYAAELHDLIKDDLVKIYPTLIPYVKITIYDVAPKILPMFDKSLSTYALENFKREKISVKTETHVEEIQEAEGGGFRVLIRNGPEGGIGVGMVVWSTGLCQSPFIKKITKNPIKPSSNIDTHRFNVEYEPKSGALLTDDRLRLKTHCTASPSSKRVMEDVFAIGDCATVENDQLPATAQVANQKAIWLAKRLNKEDFQKRSFEYHNLGTMAYIGNWKAIMQGAGKNNPDVKGRAAWILWRAAYLTKSVSWRNKIVIPTYWIVNWLFGRDISRF
jgi:NADH dehydrogenase FAD-containing subunit